MESIILQSLVEAKLGLEVLINDKENISKIAKAADLMVQTLKEKGRIFSIGNGGSMCDAMHFAEELSGRYRENRPALAAIAISDPSHLSCVSNDFGYLHVFSRYLEAHGRKDDVLLALSTSGSSQNVLKAIETAKTLGLKVVGLTGKPSLMDDLSDICISTPAGKYADRVQEIHIKIIHILIQLIEHNLELDR